MFLKLKMFAIPGTKIRFKLLNFLSAKTQVWILISTYQKAFESGSTTLV
jgi:hypothetical protein